MWTWPMPSSAPMRPAWSTQCLIRSRGNIARVSSPRSAVDGIYRITNGKATGLRKLEDELSTFRDAIQRPLGDLKGGCDQLRGALARERGLAQGPQAVVARRIRRSQHRPCAAGKLLDHIPLRRRERFPSRALPRRCRRNEK